MVGAKMTANELANLLEVDSWYKLVTREEIATMLRQQQAEIETLKQSKFKDDNKVNFELTDEEIRHIQAQFHLKNVGYDNFIMRFARAILLKAQEK
jgi:ClpP class serine protease